MMWEDACLCAGDQFWITTPHGGLQNDMPKGTAAIVSDGQRGAQSEQKPFEAQRVR